STMLTLLGRSVLSSALRLSPVYRTQLIHPLGSCYRNPIGSRAYSSEGDNNYQDVGPTPPIILYTHGVRGSEEQGSHMGIGIFAEKSDENLRLSYRRKTRKDIVSYEKSPILHAIWYALFYLSKSPSVRKDDVVIIRTHFDPVVDEFEKWRNGDVKGSKGLTDLWRQMDKW
ncbi:hypothetical protein PMAYCL1PPCAC_29908, partial [Pristionchus mayeri]